MGVKVRYIGRFPEGVVVPEHDGGVQVFVHGKPVEVSDELAARLLEQTDNWVPSGEDAKAFAADVVPPEPEEAS